MVDRDNWVDSVGAAEQVWEIELAGERVDFEYLAQTDSIRGQLILILRW